MSDLVILPARQATGATLDALAAALTRTVERITQRVVVRRTVVELSRLDDRALKDIGYCRTDLLVAGWDGAARHRAPVPS